jgi:PleD family two-component response regulator
MNHKPSLPAHPIGSRKRVLLVVTNRDDAARRCDVLRERGYDVDSVSGANDAVTFSRMHSYDLIVLPVDVDSIGVEKLSRRLHRLSPNSRIACLADGKKPIPSMPACSMLWKGEPLEYFLARIDALATSA